MKITSTNTDDLVRHEIGHRLARIRLERNRTQAQLAKEAGLGKSTLEKLEAGQSVSLTVFIRAIRALGLLEDLERFLPEPTLSPLELLDLAGRQRKRASHDGAQFETDNSSQPWTWGDETTRTES